jgi:hypothetical protein
MDIKSLNQQVILSTTGKKPSVTSIGNDVQDVELAADNNSIYDLFRATIRNFVEGINLNSYIVKPEEEMRIDLILKNIYDISDFELSRFYQEIDILFTINNIDNPLNIKTGQVIFYPPLADFDRFRIAKEADIQTGSKDTISKLGVPDKTTRTDSTRQRYLQDGVALPPTVNKEPKEGAQIKNGNYIVGGI